MQVELPEQFISDKEGFNSQGIVCSADLVESKKNIIIESENKSQLIDQIINQSITQSIN